MIGWVRGRQTRGRKDLSRRFVKELTYTMSVFSIQFLRRSFLILLAGCIIRVGHEGVVFDPTSCAVFTAGVTSVP